MTSGRLEAFSDGVFAIIITIMVLNLHLPRGADLAALKPLVPVLLAYVVSFVYVGIYWNNHHHMFHAADRVTGAVLWANLHLLFWLSLVPLVTAWAGANNRMPWPAAAYAFVLLMAGISYWILQSTLIAATGGANSLLARALGSDVKGKLSPPLYIVAIALAFVWPRLSHVLLVLVAVIWLVPDRRISRQLAAASGEAGAPAAPITGINPPTSNP